MNQKITFNGKTYNSVEEMTAEERQAYEAIMNVFGDKNQNGVPDILENMRGGVTHQPFNLQMSSTTIVHNGQVYHSADELPADLRAKYEAKMSALDADHNGIPDFAEGMKGVMGSSAAASPAPSPAASLAPMEPAFPVSSAIPVSPASAIQSYGNPSSLRWIILGAGLLFVACLGAIAVWLLLSAR